MSTPAKPPLEVEVEVSRREGGQVELKVRVPPESVTAVRERVIRAFGRRVTIPGFRKGKAPRPILERSIDPEFLQQQIIDTLVPDAYDAALEKEGLHPLDRAQVEDPDLGEDGALAFSATLTLRPEIELGEYRGLKATRRVSPVTEAQIDGELDRLRERSAQYADLPAEATVEKGDLAVIDYEMFVDGEKREEDSATGYPLEVGADDLFPQLNDVLPGARPGETREFEISYPDDHVNKSLAGKKAAFRVVVQQARRRQLPELNDDFAKQVSDLETLAALRDRVRENLEVIGKAIAEDDVRNQVVRQVCDSASLSVPDSIVGREVDRRIDSATEELERRGLALHDHLRQLGRSFEDWRADLEADARESARRALVLDEVGTREKIEVAEQEIHEEIHRRAGAERMSEEELHQRLSEPGEYNRFLTRIYQRKVVQFLVDNAEIAEEVVTPEEESPAGDGEPAEEGEAVDTY